MKPRTLILLMVAVGCGLVAAFLTSQLAGQKAEMVPLPVARGTLPQGTFIKATDIDLLFDKRMVDAKGIPPGTIVDPEHLKNKSLQRTVDKDQPVTTRDLGNTDGLAKALQEGYRAMTIRVTVDTAVAGFILPGSHVDLITNVPDPKDPKLLMAKTFMQNMLVLAVNTEDVRPENAKVMVQPGLVTLAVKLDQAERLVRVSSYGIPYMVMRRPGDDKEMKTIGATTPFGRGPTDENTDKNIEVPVAKMDIIAGTPITKAGDFFEMRPQIPSNVLKDTIMKLEDLEGKTIERTLAAGNMVRKFNLIKDDVKVGTDPIVVLPRKTHEMRIYQGANVQTHTFDGREFTPPPSVAPPKDGGSEGK